jgi:hypothetical protein
MPAQPRRRDARWRFLLSALLLLAGAGAARGQADSLEFAVKATYLYKFAPFVDWPSRAFAAAAGSFVICIAGDDPFGEMLDRAVAGQHLGEHPMAVRRVARYDPSETCHVLYAMGSDTQPAATIVERARGLPVLTVTDSARGDDAKGIIHFVVADNRVRFEIDDAAAALSGLKISSKLLSLATIVRPRP